MASTEEIIDYLCDAVNLNIEQNPDNILCNVKLWRNYILDMPRWVKLLKFLFDDDSLLNFFESLNEDDRKLYFGFGVECMINFVQANFTGPDLPSSFETFFNDSLFKNVNFKKHLWVNEEIVNVNTKYSVLFYTAKRIFKYCKWDETLNLWWQWRTIMTHQHLLEDLSQVLFSEMCALSDDINNLVLNGRMKAKFEIERAQLCNTFRRIDYSRKHLDAACDLLGVKYELHGALGKRTKFQKDDIAQLMLHVSIEEDNDKNLPSKELIVPQDVTLNDDVRLHSIKYKRELDKDAKIADVEQQLLFAIVQEMCMSCPQDELITEEIKSFLDFLLNQSNTWVIRAMVLIHRSKLECKDKRAIERCLLQLEEVISCVKKEEPHSLNRFAGVYAMNVPAIWKLEAQLADVMLKLGLVKASLDLYLRLELWEEVIVCYTLLEERHKATQVIEEQLELHPTVKLWCLLGDATDDINCYEKAWEFSKKRSSRAMRHWGHYYFIRKQYQECLSYFEKSLSINPLQSIVWLHYGYAALSTDNWQTAATAYRRYTSLEPTSFEAWNNLAKAYVELGNKRSAHQAFHEALKCNFDNWKVWDNLMAVSCDTGHFSDVINAYHRILDLKGKHLDLEILAELVHCVSTNVVDGNGRPANLLMQKTRELLGRITSIFPLNGHAWEFYATLSPGELLKGQRLQRALRGFMCSGWEKDSLNCQNVLYICTKLAQVVLSDEIDHTHSLFNSVRLSLISAISAIKNQQHEDENICRITCDVEQCLHSILEKNKDHSVQTDCTE